MHQDLRCRALLITVGLCAATARHARADEPTELNRDLVKVAAVQISGYDKGDPPREGYDPTALLIPYIDQAGKEGAQLVVFPEYVLGRISVPGPETQRMAAAAKANSIYVIVGCWEVFENDTFANTALLFDRSGRIVGKYNKIPCNSNVFSLILTKKFKSKTLVR